MEDLEIRLDLDGLEAASILEAVHDCIVKRMIWVLCDSNFREDDDVLPQVRMVISSLLSIYRKTLAVVNEFAVVYDVGWDEEFLNEITFRVEVYDLIDKVIDSKEWADVPLLTESKARKLLNALPDPL